MVPVPLQNKNRSFNFILTGPGIPYQGLANENETKQPYETIPSDSNEIESTENKTHANKDAKYEEVREVKEAKYEDIDAVQKDGKYEDVEIKKNGKYEDVNINPEENNTNRDSVYDSGGYLIATPSVIKRTEEEKIRLRKLKEMGAKIDEEKDSDKENGVAMKYSDVEGNAPVKFNGIKAAGADVSSVEKTYLRLLDVRTSTKESKL